MLENHHLDFIKQTMLKHEDTFRHQVRELHRLYNVQKNLMTTLRSETRQPIEFSPRFTLDINSDDLGPISGFDLSRPINEDVSRGDSSGLRDDLTCSDDVELTLSIGPSTSKRRSQNDTKANTKTSLGNSSKLYNQESRDHIGLFRI
ncbi:hypothetical protein M8C21_019220 [Ambrosia artemisiifolia]|uniref:Uncharacterized protein n=1 Tax=Ambrosia artemisiifolia TaxID=4212 RepID=A0AAD5DA86_AMBAR|nr:hypothetical protein M8C21_019220 [Ambrosia artemisiifolia]